MKAHEALIAWTPADEVNEPTAGQVKVGNLLVDESKDWTKPYTHTGGAAYSSRRELRGAESIMCVFIDFHSLVVGDGLDPNIVHDAFLVIDEFAERISPDIQGARGDLSLRF